MGKLEALAGIGQRFSGALDPKDIALGFLIAPLPKLIQQGTHSLIDCNYKTDVGLATVKPDFL